MNVRTTSGILTVFVLTLSMTAFAGIGSARGQHAPVAPPPFYTPSGPSSDAILMNIYTDRASEYSALAAGQIDLTDVPLTSSVVSTFCPSTVIGFLCTGPDSQFSMFEIEFNHANTFYGITDCFAQDGITNGSVCTVPGGTGPNNVPTTATCPVSVNPLTTGNCSKELIAFREGVAHLVDKQAMIKTEFSVPAGSGITGALGIALDSPSPPAQGQPHSGLPCDGLQQGATGTCGSGTFTSYTATTNHATFTLGGVCAWDFIDKAAGSSCISAESLSGLGTPGPTGSTDGVTYDVGSPDFKDSGAHWVAAGLAKGQNPDGTLCEAAPGTCFLTSAATTKGPITFIVRIDDPIRLDIGSKLAKKMCQLFGSPTVAPANIGTITSCPQMTQPLLTIGQAFTNVFTTQACPSPGPTNSCPSLGWHMYTGGFGLTEEFNQIWGLYTKQFASNFCTSSAPNASPGTVIGNYNYFCNAKFDPFAVNVQISSTFANATANLQVAQEFFGNHTGTVQLYDQAAVYAYANGWTGVTDATGFGIAQANPSTLLNAWNPNPASTGPTIRWGQQFSPFTYNPYQLGTVVEADLTQEVYDTPVLVAPYIPQAGVTKGLPFLLSYMLDSYTFVTHATDPNCPTTISRADEPGQSFAIAECLKIALRGDIFFHDGVQVTLSDFQFSEASLNSTGSLFSGGTVDTGSVVYSPSVLPVSLGGTEAVGQPEVGYVALTVSSVFAVEDLAATPILPQHVWAKDKTHPCVVLGTDACTVDPNLVFGDPAAIGPTHPSLVGSGPFVCASGPLGAPGTVVGQGCTSSAVSSVPGGGTVILRRFGSGLTPAKVAYFRDNANYAQWQWANFDGASTVDGIDISTASSCLTATPPLSGGCLHYDSPARSLTTNIFAGSPIGQNSGGDSDGLVTNFELTQVKRWFAVSWTDPVAYSVLSTPFGGNFQPTCGSANGSNAGACAGLFDDGSIYSNPPPPP